MKRNVMVLIGLVVLVVILVLVMRSPETVPAESEQLSSVTPQLEEKVDEVSSIPSNPSLPPDEGPSPKTEAVSVELPSAGPSEVVEEKQSQPSPATPDRETKRPFEIKVVRKSDGQPIPGARITMRSSRVTPRESWETDETGVVRLDLDLEEWTFKAQAEGYAQGVKRIGLSLSDISSTVIALEPGFQLWGYVTDEENQALEEVWVSSRWHEQYLSTQTQADGYYELNFLPITDTLHMSFHKRGYVDKQIQYDNKEPSELSQQLDTVMKAEPDHGFVPVTIEVYDEEGKPLNQVIPNFSYELENCTAKRPRLSRDHKINLSLDPTHSHPIQLWKRGYRRLDTVLPKELEPNQIFKLVMKVGDFLEGKVVDEQGKGIAKASLDTGLRGATTDEEGNFYIDGLEGTVKLTVLSPGFKKYSKHFGELNQAVTIQLEPGGAFAGKVENAQGEPITRFKIKGQYLMANGSTGGNLRDWMEISHDEGGFYLDEQSAAESVQLIIRAPGYRDTPTVLTARTPEEARNEPELIVMDDPLELTGYVTDMAGIPRGGTRAVLCRGTAKQLDWVFMTGLFEELDQTETHTDESGFFRLPAPPVGLKAILYVGGDHAALIFRIVTAEEVEGGEPLRLKTYNSAIIQGTANLERFPLGTTINVNSRQDRRLSFHTALTEQSGEFTIRGLAPGAHKLTARQGDHSETLEIEVSEGETLPVLLGFDEFVNFRGQIRMGGVVVPYAGVYLRHEIEGKTYERVADGNGDFTFLDIPKGAYRLFAFDEKRNTNTFRLHQHPNFINLNLQEDYEQMIELERYGRLIGHFAEPGLRTVSLRGINDSVTEFLQGKEFHFINVPPGEYSLFTSEGLLLEGVIMPEDGSDVDLGLVENKNKGKLLISLRGATAPETTLAIFNGQIAVYQKNIKGVGPIVLDDLPLGSWKIHASSHHDFKYAQSKERLIEINETGQAEIVLEMLPMSFLTVINLSSMPFRNVQYRNVTTGEVLDSQVFETETLVPGELYLRLEKSNAAVAFIQPGIWEVVVTFDNERVVTSKAEVKLGELTRVEVAPE